MICLVKDFSPASVCHKTNFNIINPAFLTKNPSCTVSDAA